MKLKRIILLLLTVMFSFSYGEVFCERWKFAEKGFEKTSF